MAVTKQLVVQIADMKMTRQTGTIITYALGSCVGISFYDKRIKLAALLHIMLPQTLDNTQMSDKEIFKFADTGIKETLRKMTVLGGDVRSIQVKIAGGAKMFEGLGSGDFGSIGSRNVDEVKARLREAGIAVSAQEVGGNIARTMSLDVETGIVKIKTIGKPEIIL